MSLPNPTQKGPDARALEDRARAEAEALEREATAAHEGPAAARLWLAVADLRERAGEADRALAALEAARALEPNSRAILGALRRLAMRQWRWPLAADVLTQERKIASGEERVVRSLELAEVLAERLGRAEEALALLSEVLESDPADSRALGRAVPMWIRASAWTELTGTLEAAAESVGETDRARSAALLCEAAEICRWRIHSTERAIDYLRRALAVDPQSALAAKSLAEIASESRLPELLAKALERESDVAGSPELAAAALVKLGAVREDLLQDPAGAEEAYSTALGLDRANRPALAALSRIAESRADHQMRADLLEKQLLLATDVKEAVAISLALGSLYEESLGSKERAANHYRRVLAVTADEAPAFRALGRLLASTGDWQGLVDLYEREAKETPDPVHRVHCLFKIAELHEERLDDVDGAIAAFKRVLAVSPTYLPALRALGRLYQKRGDWRGLVELYQGEAAATEDPAHAIELYTRVADLLEDKLNDTESATDTWKKVHAMKPEHLPALRALGRLYYRRGAWEELVKVNLEEARLTRDPRVVAALLHKTGEVYEEKLSLPDDAFRCYREALDHVGNYLPAMRSLGRLASMRGEWAEVIRTEELEAEGTADPRRAASLLASAAEHYETRLKDDEKAIGAYERVLARVPTYLPALSGLARLYRKAGRWTDLIRILLSEVPAIDRDPGAAAVILSQVAAIEAHRLKRDTDAQERLVQALAAAPRDQTIRRDHEEYLARASDWAGLVAAYAATAEAAAPGPLKTALYVRLGALAATQQGPSSAAGFLRAALQVTPGDRAASAALERLGRSEGDERMRIEALEAMALSARNLAERRSLLVELARLHDRAHDLPATEACWSAAAQITPDADVLEALADSQTRAGKHAEAAESFERAHSFVTDELDRERFCIAAAESRLAAGQPDKAEAILVPIARDAKEPTAALTVLARALTERGPDAADALVEVRKRLASIARDPARKTELTLAVAKSLTGPLSRAGEATSLLEQVVATEPAGSQQQRDALRQLAEIYGARGEVGPLAATLERLAEGAQGADRAGYLIEAAEHLKGTDPERAMLVLERASAADPASMAALRGLIDLYERRAQWQPLLAAWNRVIQGTKDPKVAAEAFYKKGVILSDQLQLADKGEEHFKRALSAFPSYAPALERMAKSVEARGSVDEARETLRKLLQLDPEDSPLTQDRLLHLAALEKRAKNYDAALTQFHAVMARAPQRTDVHEEILSILEAQPTGNAFIAALRNASLTATEPRRTELRRRLAKALEEKGKDDAGAIAEWRALARANPADAEPFGAMAAIFAKRGAKSDAIAAHNEALKRDPARVASLSWLEPAYEELKAHDKRLCLIGVLDFLGAASESQRIFYLDQGGRAPRSGTPDDRRGGSLIRAVSLEDRRALLVHPEARSNTGDLLSRLAPFLWSGVVADFGNPRPERPADRSPIRLRLDGLRALFGAPPIEVLIAKDKSTETRIAPGDPVVLIVGGAFSTLSSGVQDFLLARDVFRIAVGWFPETRTADDVRRDLALAAMALDVGETRKDLDPKRVKSISRAVPRKLRKELADPLQVFVQRPQAFDVDAFLRGAEKSADRAGLLACVEIARAADGLALLHPTLPSQGFAKHLSGRELLAFATSEELFALRKKTGLTIFP